MEIFFFFFSGHGPPKPQRGSAPGGDYGLGILTTCGWGCGCMAGYTFLLSWMDEEFSRFLGKQGKLSPLIVGAREEELVLYRGSDEKGG